MKKFKTTMMMIFSLVLVCAFMMGCKKDPPEEEETVNLQGKVLVLQAYGSSSDAAGASHSFVELYNITDEELKLDGVGLYYADGTSVASDAVPNNATADGAWKRISLDGKTIPAKGSFLILGSKQSAAARYQIDDGSGDINDPNFSLSNRAFKVALIKSTKDLTVQNPFNPDDSGKPVSGYIDMVGAANEYQGRDLIFGFETAPARNSASVAVRRRDLTDTDDNSLDFIAARYAKDGMSAKILEIRKPRNSSAGTWDPFAAPEVGEGSPQLMILQVFGMHADNDSAPTHSFIELYNNTNDGIDLSGYSVHWANGNSSNNNAPSEKDVWNKIDLTGSIPAKNSYLILGPQVVDATTIANSSTNGRLDLTTTTADTTSASFKMSNRSYKVALMSNQVELTAPNPWGDAACIDLVSAINTSGTDSVTAAKGAADLTAVNGASGGTRTISKQKSFRRTSLAVTESTLEDFTSIQYSTVPMDDIDKFRPRATNDGEWAPQF